jgi:hypothetical protein
MGNVTVHQPNSRIEHGRRLYAEHAEDIVFQDGVWLVPSQNTHTSRYEVVIGYRGEWCECSDWTYRSPEGGCLHIVAATLARAKTFRCEGCGDRFPNREMFQIMEPDHLSFFEGDPLCESCAGNHGVL